MSRKTFLKLIVGLAAAGLLAFLIIYIIPAADTAENIMIRGRSAVYARLSFIGTFFSEIKRTRHLMEENTRLKEENLALLSRIAEQEQIEERSKFLEEALNLTLPENKRIYDAGIYNIRFSPEGYYFLINKGDKEGVKSGDIVISLSGVLIGIVKETSGNYSETSAVMNQGFRATIKIMSKDIAGIAKGALENGVSLDFISQEDEVGEGDTVITAGNDTFPAGLIIGKVISVTSENGSLFKNVKVDPALRHIDMSRALVISQ